MTSPEQLRVSAADDIVLSADVWEGDKDRVVLFLHGGGQTRQAWGGAAEAVAGTGARVLSFDLRGHGDSDWPDEPDYDFAHFGSDVTALCAQLPVSPVVIGASLGGIACLTAQGAADRQLFRGLVLVDVTPRMEMRGVVRIVSFMIDNPQGFESLDDAAEAIAEYLPHRRRPTDTSGLRRVLREAPDGRWRWHWDPRFMIGRVPLDDEGQIAFSHERLDGFRAALLQDAACLEVPTLLVRGAMTDMVSDEGVRELLEAVPHAEYVDVSDATHMVAGDRNDVFTAEVLRFVQSVGG